MAHATRSRRKLNNWRRNMAEFKQRPVPLAEQAKRHAEREANKPEPPVYVQPEFGDKGRI
jgi:hypothetical protein